MASRLSVSRARALLVLVCASHKLTTVNHGSPQRAEVRPLGCCRESLGFLLAFLASMAVVAIRIPMSCLTRAPCGFGIFFILARTPVLQFDRRHLASCRRVARSTKRSAALRQLFLLALFEADARREDGSKIDPAHHLVVQSIPTSSALQCRRTSVRNIVCSPLASPRCTFENSTSCQRSRRSHKIN